MRGTNRNNFDGFIKIPQSITLKTSYKETVKKKTKKKKRKRNTIHLEPVKAYETREIKNQTIATGSDYSHKLTLQQTEEEEEEGKLPVLRRIKKEQDNIPTKYKLPQLHTKKKEDSQAIPLYLQHLRKENYNNALSLDVSHINTDGIRFEMTKVRERVKLLPIQKHPPKLMKKRRKKKRQQPPPQKREQPPKILTPKKERVDSPREEMMDHSSSPSPEKERRRVVVKRKPSKTIYVGGIPHRWKEQQIIKLFEPLNVKVRIAQETPPTPNTKPISFYQPRIATPKNKGFAFVEFQSHNIAKQVLQQPIQIHNIPVPMYLIK